MMVRLLAAMTISVQVDSGGHGLWGMCFLDCSFLDGPHSNHWSKAKTQGKTLSLRMTEHFELSGSRVATIRTCQAPSRPCP